MEVVPSAYVVVVVTEPSEFVTVVVVDTVVELDELELPDDELDDALDDAPPDAAPLAPPEPPLPDFAVSLDVPFVVEGAVVVVDGF